MSISFRLIPRYIRVPLWAAMLVALASCSAGTDSVSGPSAPTSALSASRFFYSLPVASVRVSPSSSSLTTGQSLQFTATAHNALGATVTGNLVTWTSSNPSAVTVTSAGAATAVATGNATLTATVAGKSGSASVTVTAATVATAASAPGTVSDLTVAVINDTSATLTFTEVSNGSGGAASVDVRYAVAPISWGTATSATRGTCATTAALASVGSAAQCTVLGLTKGTSYNFQLVTYRGTLNKNAVFGAVSNIASGTTTATAAAAPAAPAAPVVGSVAVTPATATATVGVPLALTATVKDKNNNVMTGQTITWTSSNTAVATVSAAGTTTGLAAGTVTFTATTAGVSGTATVTEAAAAAPATQPAAAPSSGSYPNQPAGYARIAETDYSALPSLSGMIAGAGQSYANPSALQTIASGSGLPISFPVGSGHALKYIIETGTAAGYSEANGDYAGNNIWALGDPGDAAGGPADNEYSAFYQSTYFSVYGNGTTVEVPAGPGIKVLGYWGVTNNNQNGSGPGPTEIYSVFSPVTTASTAPLTTSQMHIDMYTQNGSNLALPQNLNLSKTVVVGQVHHFEQVLTLGTAGGSNGTWDWWLDGVHIGSYSNVPFINASYAANGGNGLSGFWGWQFSPVWGGSGGPAKTRSDAIYLGYTYISGLFLRNHQ